MTSTRLDGGQTQGRTVQSDSVLTFATVKSGVGKGAGRHPEGVSAFAGTDIGVQSTSEDGDGVVAFVATNRGTDQLNTGVIEKVVSVVQAINTTKGGRSGVNKNAVITSTTCHGVVAGACTRKGDAVISSTSVGRISRD